jgi:hypothetical protein
LTLLCIAVNSYIKYIHFEKMQALFCKKSKKNGKTAFYLQKSILSG